MNTARLKQLTILIFCILGWRSAIAQVNHADSAVSCVLNVAPKDVIYYDVYGRNTYIQNNDTVINHISRYTVKQTILERSDENYKILLDYDEISFEPDMNNIMTGISIIYVTNTSGVFEQIVNVDNLYRQFKIKFAYLTKKYQNQKKMLKALKLIKEKYKDENTILQTVAKDIRQIHYFLGANLKGYQQYHFEKEFESEYASIPLKKDMDVVVSHIDWKRQDYTIRCIEHVNEKYIKTELKKINNNAIPIGELKHDLVLENTYTSNGLLKKSNALSLAKVKLNNIESITINDTLIEQK